MPCNQVENLPRDYTSLWRFQRPVDHFCARLQLCRSRSSFPGKRFDQGVFRVAIGYLVLEVLSQSCPAPSSLFPVTWLFGCTWAFVYVGRNVFEVGRLVIKDVVSSHIGFMALAPILNTEFLNNGDQSLVQSTVGIGKWTVYRGLHFVGANLLETSYFVGLPSFLTECPIIVRLSGSAGVNLDKFQQLAIGSRPNQLECPFPKHQSVASDSVGLCAFRFPKHPS